MAAVALSRRSRKLFGNKEINNPPPPPQEPFDVPLPPFPPVDVNLPALPPPPNQNHPPLSLTLTIFLSIFFVGISLITCCLRAMALRGRRRAAAAAAPPQQQPQEGGEVYSGLMVDHPIWYIRTVGLHSSVINAIAVCKYKEVEGIVGKRAECAVCLNGFQEDDTLRMLPKCNHAFHVSCIDTWLKSHKNCPVCRAIIELVEELELRNNIVKNENEGE